MARRTGGRLLAIFLNKVVCHGDGIRREVSPPASISFMALLRSAFSSLPLMVPFHPLAASQESRRVFRAWQVAFIVLFSGFRVSMRRLCR